MPGASSTSAKRTVVVAMTITAGVVFLGHGADTTKGATTILATTVVAVMLALLAEIAPALAAAFAVVILTSAWLDNGQMFTRALASLTGKKAP